MGWGRRIQKRALSEEVCTQNAIWGTESPATPSLNNVVYSVNFLQPSEVGNRPLLAATATATAVAKGVALLTTS